MQMKFLRHWQEDFETKHVPKVFEKIGKYYYDDPVERKNGEFDIVTLDNSGYIFYEAKFRKEPLTENMIEKEIAQVRQTGLECYKYVFFKRWIRV